MKYVILTLLVTILLLSLGACINESKPNKTYKTVVIVDKTESYFEGVTSKDLMARSILEKDTLAGEHVVYTTITSRSLNPVYEAEITPVESVWGYNELYRRKEIQSYVQALKELIPENDSTAETPEKGSEVYAVVAKQLNSLANSEADVKRLIINSDLMEHSAIISFYDSKVKDSLGNNPDHVIRILEKYIPSQDLNGVTIYLIFNPPNKLSSREFELASNLYKTMLERHGAQVEVRARLPYQLTQ